MCVFTMLFLIFLSVFCCHFIVCFLHFQVLLRTFTGLAVLTCVRFCRSFLFVLLFRPIRSNYVCCGCRWLRCSHDYPSDYPLQFLAVCSVLSCVAPSRNDHSWSCLPPFWPPTLICTPLHPSAPINVHHGCPMNNPNPFPTHVMFCQFYSVWLGDR